jgi:hypothetical protein
MISLPVHQLALVVNGVHLLENLKLDELVSKNAQEFAFIMTPRSRFVVQPVRRFRRSRCAETFLPYVGSLSRPAVHCVLCTLS